jgi:hypothetical protein
MASIIKANQLQDFGGNSILTSDGAGVVTPNASGIKNVPAFEAYNSGNQSLSDASATKLEFDTEVFDSNGTFSSNRFTPGVAGKYFIHSKSHFGTGSDTTLIRCYYYIYKNGSSYAMTNFDTRSGGNFRVLPNHISAIMDLNATDYVEIYAYVDVSSGSITGPNSGEKQLFGAYRIIGA